MDDIIVNRANRSAARRADMYKNIRRVHTSEYSISSPKTPRMQKKHKELEKDLLKTPKIKKSDIDGITITADDIQNNIQPLKNIDVLLRYLENIKGTAEAIEDRYWTAHGRDVMNRVTKDHYEFDIKMHMRIYQGWMDEYPIDDDLWFTALSDNLTGFANELRRDYDWIEDWFQVGRSSGWLCLEAKPTVLNAKEFVDEMPENPEDVESFNFSQDDIDEAIKTAKEHSDSLEKLYTDLAQIKTNVENEKRALSESMKTKDFWRDMGVDIPQEISPETRKWEQRWRKRSSLNKKARVYYIHGNKEEDGKMVTFKVESDDWSKAEDIARIVAREHGMGLAGGASWDNEPVNAVIYDTSHITPEQVSEEQNAQEQQRQERIRTQYHHQGKDPIAVYDDSEFAEDIIAGLTDDILERDYIFQGSDEIMAVFDQIKDKPYPQATNEFWALLKEQDLEDELERLIEDEAYSDTDMFDAFSDDFYSAFDEAMKELNEGGTNWKITANNLGWRQLAGEKEFDITDAHQFVEKILPNTEMKIRVWEHKFDDGTTGLYLRVSHHDAPMGENYYCYPLKGASMQEKVRKWEQRWRKRSSLKIAVSEQFVMQWFEKAFQRKATDDWSYFQDWVRRFENDTALDRMDLERRSVYFDMLGQEDPLVKEKIKKEKDEQDANKWEQRWHKKSNIAVNAEDTRYDEFQNNTYVIFVDDAKFKIDQLDAMGEIKKNMIGKVKKVTDSMVMVEIGKQLYEIPLLEAFKIMEPFKATVVTEDREEGDELAEEELIPGGGVPEEVPEEQPQETELSRPSISTEREEMKPVPIKSPKKPLEKALETASVLYNMMKKIGQSNTPVMAIGDEVWVKINPDTNHLTRGKIMKIENNIYTVKIADKYDLDLTTDRLIYIGPPKPEIEKKQRRKVKKEIIDENVVEPTWNSTPTADQSDGIIVTAEMIDTQTVIVPNWFDKETLEDTVNEEITEEEYYAFKDWLEEGDLMSDVSYQIQEHYAVWRRAHPKKSDDDVRRWEQRWKKHSKAIIPDTVYDVINELSPDDIGTEIIGKYTVRFEGFTQDCWDDFYKRKITIDKLTKEILNGWNKELASDKLVEYGWQNEGIEGEDDVFYAIYKNKTIKESTRNHKQMTKEALPRRDEFSFDSSIDFRYADENFEFNNETKEYELLNDLNEDEWAKYLEFMASSGVTVEYSSVEDKFQVYSSFADDESGYALCVDCSEKIDDQELTDIQLCEQCMKNYDMDRLWEKHDRGELDALDFNENEQMREKFRKSEEPSDDVKRWEQRWRKRSSIDKYSGNRLNINLDNKYVILSPKYYKGDEHNRMVLVRGGFGVEPTSMGNALFVTFVIDGEETRAEGYQVERLATDEEIKKYVTDKQEKTERWERRWNKRSDKGVVGMDKIILGQIEISDQMLDEDGMWLSRDLWEREISYRVQMIEQYLGSVERGINVIGNIRSYLDDLEEILEKIPPDQIESAREYLNKQLSDNPKTALAISKQAVNVRVHDWLATNVRGEDYTEQDTDRITDKIMAFDWAEGLNKESVRQEVRAWLGTSKKASFENEHGIGEPQERNPLKELNKVIKKRDNETLKIQKVDERGDISTSTPSQDTQKDINGLTNKSSELIDKNLKKGGRVQILKGVHKGESGIVSELRNGIGACRVQIGGEAVWYKENEVKLLASSDMGKSSVIDSEFPAVEADIQAGFRLLIDEMDSHNPYVVSEIGRKLYKQQQKQNKEIVRESMIHGHKKQGG